MHSFIEELVQQGLVSENRVGGILALADEKFGGSVEAALVSEGVPEDKILEVKSGYYNIPKLLVDPKQIGTELLKYIPEDSAKHYKIVPLGVQDGALLVGITNPENIQASDALQFIASKNNMPYKLFVIPESTFNAVMKAYDGLGGQVDQAISDLDSEIEQAAKMVETTTGQPQEVINNTANEEALVEEAPIIKIVAVILNHAVEGNASDIHIENTGDKVKVRFRVDGLLHTSLVLPLSVYAGVVARIKILAKLRLDEKRKPQDGGFSARLGGRKIDFRVSALPTYYGEKLVLRILDTEKGVKPLAELGLSDEHLKLVQNAIAKPYGLILITGPTGSGKSTTLYSLLNELDKEKYNIVSLEDPVEYHIPGVNQSQVMPEIGYSFASGLRSILRQDPNIIMVGEIRDKETAQLAIQAALTGHLVFSTLHTNNAIGIVPRLVDMGIDPYLIAPTLVLSIAQRLVRTTCDGGSQPADDQTSLQQMAEKTFSDLPEEFKKNVPLGKEFTKAVGTSDCPNGTRGRMAVFEMFETNEELQSLILKKPVDTDIYDLMRKDGYLTMKEDAIIKCVEGKIPFQEIYTL